MTTATRTTAEISNRTAKAIALADVLEAHGADPRAVHGMPELGWSMACRLAGFDPKYSPSPDTRALVVTVLTDRKRNAGLDPFRGLS